jgi:hypothetical protein
LAPSERWKYRNSCEFKEDLVNKTIRLLALLVAACALLVAPAIGQAHHKPGHTKGPKNGQPNSKRCKPTKPGFVVRGTLVSFTADNPATTPANEASVTITVTGANRHARNSGDIADQDPTTPGTQVQGAPFTVSGLTDPFKVQLVGYEGADTPSPGDPVKVIGKVERTKKKCAPAGTSLADRYGDVNVRKVVIKDADPDV